MKRGNFSVTALLRTRAYINDKLYALDTCTRLFPLNNTAKQRYCACSDGGREQTTLCRDRWIRLLLYFPPYPPATTTSGHHNGFLWSSLCSNAEGNDLSATAFARKAPKYDTERIRAECSRSKQAKGRRGNKYEERRRLSPSYGLCGYSNARTTRRWNSIPQVGCVSCLYALWYSSYVATAG